jgi:hypothetical protein
VSFGCHRFPRGARWHASSPVPWLIRSPLALVVLDRESGEFFLRCRATAFPGREIADLLGSPPARFASRSTPTS